MSLQTPGRFVILGNQRSRSTLLVQLLDRHPELVCHGELFIPEKFVLSSKSVETTMLRGIQAASTDDVAARDKDPLGFLERVMETTPAASPTLPRSIGHKLLRGNSSGVLNASLADPTVAKLVLIRNEAYCVTSKLLARLTQEWVRLPGEPQHAKSLYVDPGDFARTALANRYYLDTVLSQLASGGHRFRVVFSEDVATQDSFDEICSFLGVSEFPVETVTTVQRQNSRQMRERVKNFDELCGFLQDTPFLELLEEDRTRDRDRWLSYQQGTWGKSPALDSRLDELMAFSALEWKVMRSSRGTGKSRMAAAWRALTGRDS